MLKLSHIKKSYKKNEVLTDISFTFEEGQIYPILGGPGAGRTTLFECICGDISVDDGSIVTIDKCKYFYAAKQSVLPVYITGYEFISMLCDMERDDPEPEDIFDRIGFSVAKRDELIADYTFEEKKLLQLACILVIRPYVVLFDEPLDYCSEEYRIILISTGLLEISKRISEDTLVLNNGEFNHIDKKTMEIPEIRKAVLDILGETDNEII